MGGGGAGEQTQDLDQLLLKLLLSGFSCRYLLLKPCAPRAGWMRDPDTMSTLGTSCAPA